MTGIEFLELLQRDVAQLSTGSLKGNAESISAMFEATPRELEYLSSFLYTVIQQQRALNKLAVARKRSRKTLTLISRG